MGRLRQVAYYLKYSRTAAAGIVGVPKMEVALPVRGQIMSHSSSTQINLLLITRITGLTMFADLSLQSRLEHAESDFPPNQHSPVYQLLVNKIESLNDLIEAVGAALKSLSHPGSKLSKNEIQAELERLSAQIAAQSKTQNSFIAERNNFSQKQHIGLDSTLTLSPAHKIYEVPVEMHIEAEPSKIYEVCVDLQKFESTTAQEVQNYLQKFTKWAQLEKQLKSSIEKLWKTRSSSLLKKDDHFEFSFFRSQMGSEDSLEGSFSISEVKKRTSSSRDLCCQAVQTEPIPEQPRSKKSQHIYEIPIQLVVMQDQECFLSNFNNLNLSKNVEVDSLSERSASYLKPENTSEKDDQSATSLDQLVNQARLNENSLKNSGYVDADQSMGRLYRLLYETPNIMEENDEEMAITLQNLQRETPGCLTAEEPLSEQTIKDIDQSLGNLNKILLNYYNIPIDILPVKEIQMESSQAWRKAKVSEARLSATELAENERFLGEIADKMEIIKQILDENPYQIDQYFEFKEISLQISQPLQVSYANQEPQQWNNMEGMLQSIEGVVHTLPDRRISPLSENQTFEHSDEKKDWDDINDSIISIQKSLNEIPRWGNIFRKTYTEQVAHVDSYTIPVDMEIVEEIEPSQDKEERLQANEELHVISEEPQIVSSERHVSIKNYIISYEMEIVDDVTEEEIQIAEEANEFITRQLCLDSNIYQETIFEVKGMAKMTLPETQNTLELNNVESHEEQSLDISGSKIPMDASPCQMRQQCEIITQIEPLNFNVFAGSILELDQSDGNLTDRSSYLRRALNNSANREKNSSLTSRSFKEGNVNAEQFYTLQENLRLVEEERDKLLQVAIECENEVNRVLQQNKIQKKYIQDLNKFSQHENNTFSVELCSKLHKIDRLESQLKFNLSLIHSLQRGKELSLEKIEELKQALDLKTKSIEYIQEQKAKLAREMSKDLDKLREENDENALLFCDKQRAYQRDIFGLKQQIQDLRQLNQELENENTLLGKKLNENISKIDELDQKETNLMEGIEAALSQMEGQNFSPERRMKDIYEGQFKKKKKTLEKQLFEKDMAMNILEAGYKILECKVSELEEQNMRIKAHSNLCVQPSWNMNPSSMMAGFFSEMPSQFSILHEAEVDEQIHELRQEVAQANKELFNKNNEIQILKREIEAMRENSKSNIVASFNEKSPNGGESLEQQELFEYINKLEIIVESYEKIIQDNQYEIRDLQKDLMEAMEGGLEREIRIQQLEELFRRANNQNNPKEEEKFEVNAFNQFNLQLHSSTHNLAPIHQPKVHDLDLSFEEIKQQYKGGKWNLGGNSTMQSRLMAEHSNDDSYVEGRRRQEQRNMKKCLNKSITVTHSQQRA